MTTKTTPSTKKKTHTRSYVNPLPLSESRMFSVSELVVDFVSDMQYLNLSLMSVFLTVYRSYFRSLCRFKWILSTSTKVLIVNMFTVFFYKNIFIPKYLYFPINITSTPIIFVLDIVF